MTTPRRLLDTGTPFERAVLESAQQDAGSDEGLKRTLVAMGIGTAAALATTTSATAGAAAAGAATGTTAGLAAGGTAALGGLGAGVLVKWIGLAALVVGATTATAVSVKAVTHRANLPAAATVGAAPVSTRAARPMEPTPLPSFSGHDRVAAGLPNEAPSESALQAPAPTTNRDAPPRADGTVATLAAAGSTPDRQPAPAARIVRDEPPLPAQILDDPVSTQAPETPPVPPPVVAEPRQPSALDREAAALDRVRRALAQHNPDGALAELEAYRRAFPSSSGVGHAAARAADAPSLGEEAAVLLIDAYMQRGDYAAVDVLARRFLANHPSSPHAPHLRDLVSALHNP